MSQENVEMSYRGRDALNRRDIEALLETLDSEVEWTVAQPGHHPKDECSRAPVLLLVCAISGVVLVSFWFRLVPFLARSRHERAAPEPSVHGTCEA